MTFIDFIYRMQSELGSSDLSAGAVLRRVVKEFHREFQAAAREQEKPRQNLRVGPGPDDEIPF